MSANKGAYRAPAFIASIAELAVEEMLREAVCEPEKAAQIGNAIARAVALNWGGQHMYIPRAVWNQSNVFWCERWDRDLQIYQAYTGDNVDALATRFGLDTSTVRRVLTRVRDRLRSPETIPSAAAPSAAPRVARAAPDQASETRTMPAAPRVLDLFSNLD